MHLHFRVAGIQGEGKKDELIPHFIKKKIAIKLLPCYLLFHMDSRELHRLNTFLRHEPLGKCFDLCTITMH